jgi:8-oxo-dGTP pyrophosphatase MutT (NUDIX family)
MMPDVTSAGRDRRDNIVTGLREAVTLFYAMTEREMASRARFLAELERLADPLSRDDDPVHVTGSGLVAGRRGTVLHWHKRLGGWLQPGGHVDAGETPWAAALRETAEETGLAVRHPAAGPVLLHLDAHPAGRHFHLDLRYVLHADDDDPAPPPGESQQVRWFTLAEAMERADDALIDGLRRLQAYLEVQTSGELVRADGEPDGDRQAADTDEDSKAIRGQPAYQRRADPSADEEACR